MAAGEAQPRAVAQPEPSFEGADPSYVRPEPSGFSQVDTQGSRRPVSATEDVPYVGKVYDVLTA